MTGQTLHRRVWALIRRQHGVATRRQLLDLGYSAHAIDHRIATGRLHPVYRGVFAVGRPELTVYGRWMAAVLSCGDDAVLSHTAAAALWGIHHRASAIHISVPKHVMRERTGIVTHRRTLRPEDITTRYNIPVTTPIATLIDLAAQLARDDVEQAINEADQAGLTNPQAIRSALDDMPRRPGVATLRKLLDRRTFRFTRSQLERWFRPIAHRAGLPTPETRCYVNGFEVDFHWPELGLVIDTDGLTYHRTPAQQAEDRLRDQVHTAAGLTPLRFTHAQIRYEPNRVGAVLRAVARRLEPR
jgi:very-short-patch-repair endonuclease